LQDLNQLPSFSPIGEWTTPFLDANQEVLALNSQWLLLLQMRDIAIAVMVGITEPRKSVVVRRSLDTYIVHPNLLQRLDVIVDDHPPGSDDRHLAALPGFEPTALDRGEAVVPEKQ